MNWFHASGLLAVHLELCKLFNDVNLKPFFFVLIRSQHSIVLQCPPDRHSITNLWPARPHNRPQEASLCMKEESILAWSIFICWIKTDSHPESCARCCLVVQRWDKGRKTRFGGVVNRNARLSCFSSSNIVSSRGSEVATCQPCRMPLGGRSHQRSRWPRCNSTSYSARRLCGYETTVFPRFVS